MNDSLLYLAAATVAGTALVLLAVMARRHRSRTLDWDMQRAFLDGAG